VFNGNKIKVFHKRVKLLSIFTKRFDLH
jgi:hypothetical protein